MAGQGIEYCFGQAKWWYKKYNFAGTAASLRELSRNAFDSSVVTKDHVRKFAWKARDYMRIYRAGVKGLAAESTIKTCKTHRCAGLVDREDERKGQASKAPCSIPAATLKEKLKALVPLGAGLLSSLLYRSDYQRSLKGHYDHSLLSSTVFLVVISLWPSPLGG